MYLFVLKEKHIVDLYSIVDHHLLDNRLVSIDYHDLEMHSACLR